MLEKNNPELTEKMIDAFLSNEDLLRQFVVYVARIPKPVEEALLIGALSFSRAVMLVGGERLLELDEALVDAITTFDPEGGKRLIEAVKEETKKLFSNKTGFLDMIRDAIADDPLVAVDEIARSSFFVALSSFPLLLLTETPVETIERIENIRDNLATVSNYEN